MSRRLLGCAVLAVVAFSAEPALGIHGHWPVGTSVLLGLGGSLLLALGAKALGAAGLQRPDTANVEEDDP